MSLGLALIQCRPRPPAMTYLINTFVVTFAFLRCGSGPKVDWGMRCSIACVSSDRQRERGVRKARATTPWQGTSRCSCQSCLSCPLRSERSAPRFFIVANEIWLCREGSAALSQKESRKYTGWLMQAILTASARELALIDYCELCSQINNKSLLYLVSYQCEEGSIFALWRSW